MKRENFGIDDEIHATNDKNKVNRATKQQKHYYKPIKIILLLPIS